MSWIVAAVAIAVGSLGLFGIVSPAGLVDFVRRWRFERGFWLATGLRLILGIALWFVAPASRTPWVLRILALLSVVAAISLLAMGLERYQALLSWWEGRSAGAVRIWCCAALAFGLFLLWSVFT
jgi:hypothetical protein